MKIKLVNPEWIFLTEGPVIFQDQTPNDYYDKSEINMHSYLQILPSIVLYGFKYVVILDRSNRVLDGNFRVYTALELGLKVPCICSCNREGIPAFLYRLVWRLRHLIGINYLFQRKIMNKSFRGRNSVLVCHFQKDDFP